MRVLLDHELLTVREAQRVLNVNRCTIDEMIMTGKLATVKIGSQLKVEGRSLKELLSQKELKNRSFSDLDSDRFIHNASPNELAMIADWT